MCSPTPPGAQDRAGTDSAPPSAPEPAAAADTSVVTAPVTTNSAAAPTSAQETRQRAEVQTVADLLLAPGHHTLTGGCTSEPATAVRATVAAGLRRSLAVVPTHAVAAGVARAMRDAGLDAAAYPKLTRDTCLVWDTGPGDATDAGLPVASLFCPKCPHRQGPAACPFIRARKTAEGAAHLVLTSHRAALDPADRAAGRDAVLFVQAHPADTLRPCRAVPAGDGDDAAADPAWESESLRMLHAAAETLVATDERLREVVVDPTDYWPWVGRLARAADDALRAAGPANLPLPGPSDPAVRKRAGDRYAELWPIWEERPTRPAAGVTRAILAAAAGELVQFAVYPHAALAVGSTSTAAPPAGGHLIELHRLRRLPADLPVVALGDYDVENLSVATGVRWDAAAGTGADVWARVTRVLRRVTAASRPTRHLDRVRLLLKLYPGRVGVIAHPNLLKSLSRRMDTESWSEAERGRIVTAKWFAQDPAHLTGCDVILGLGAPRPHRVAVFKRLIQAGDPAAFDEPGWGETAWEGVGADGQPALVAGHGYGHPAWQAADREIAVGVLRAWLGGTACPVVLVADDRLDVPLGGAADGGGLTDGCARVLAALTAELAARPAASVPEHAPVPVSPIVSGLKTRELVTRLDEPERTVRHWTAELAARGLIGRVSKFAAWTATGERSDTPDDLPEGCRRVLSVLRADAVADSRSARIKTSMTGATTQNKDKKKSIDEMRAAERESARTVPQLADLLGLPRLAVRRHVNRLVVLGFVCRARGTGARGAALWTLTRLACPDAVADPAAVPAHDEVRGNIAADRPDLPFVAAAYAASLCAADQTPDAPRL